MPAVNILEALNNLDAKLTTVTANLTTAIGGLTQAMNNFRPCECPVGTEDDQPTTTEGQPPPTGYVEYDPVDYDKCKMANMVYDDVLEVTKRLKAVGTEDAVNLGLVTTASTIAFVMGGLSIGAIVWGAAGFEAILDLARELYANGLTVNLDALITNMEQPQTREDMVCAVYEAPDNVLAHDALKTALSDNGASTLQLGYIDALNLLNGLTMVFFGPTAEERHLLIEQRMAAYTGGIDCSACAGIDCEWEFLLSNGQPGGSGDLTKDGSQRTLTAVLGGGYYNLHIGLEKTGVNPGDDCNGNITVNSEVTIHSIDPAGTEDVMGFREMWWWNGETWSNSNMPYPISTDPTQVRAEFWWQHTSPFTVDITLTPGVVEG